MTDKIAPPNLKSCLRPWHPLRKDCFPNNIGAKVVYSGRAFGSNFTANVCGGSIILFVSQMIQTILTALLTLFRVTLPSLGLNFALGAEKRSNLLYGIILLCKEIYNKRPFSAQCVTCLKKTQTSADILYYIITTNIIIVILLLILQALMD